MKKYTYPIIFLWSSSMGYIFISSYRDNMSKLKKMEEKGISIDKFDNVKYNPFRYIHRK